MPDKIYYKKGYKYRLDRDYQCYIPDGLVDGVIVGTDGYCELHSDGLLILRRGYSCDGPSGPTIDTNTFMRGAFIHDALYQLMREDKLDRKNRDFVDRLLREHCLEDKMAKFRAWYVYRMVKRFATESALAINVRKIYEAPN